MSAKMNKHVSPKLTNAGHITPENFNTCMNEVEDFCKMCYVIGNNKYYKSNRFSNTKLLLGGCL